MPSGAKERPGSLGPSSIWAWLCLGAGALQALTLNWPTAQGAQPVGWVQPLAMALLCLAVCHAGNNKEAFWRGVLFSVAWLLSVFAWLVDAMHTYGGLPWWGAALATLALAVFLGSYTTVALVLWRRWAQPLARPWRAVGLWAALWTLAELLRGHWFTGFPWGAVAYAHGDTLGGWAPWLGVYGVTGLVAAVGAALGLGLWFFQRGRFGQAVRWCAGAVLCYALAAVVSPTLQAFALKDTRATGEFRVRLLQGNIAQDEKFDAKTGAKQALDWYLAQIARAWSADSPQAAPHLVIAPETALPMLPPRMGNPAWEALLQGIAKSIQLPDLQATQGAALMVGLPLSARESGYTNSVWGIDARQAQAALQAAVASSAIEAVQVAPFYRYDKHHLVPFGEFPPKGLGWFSDFMQIPFGDFQRGEPLQPVWDWGGQRISAHICYEDLFGEELAAQFTQPRPPTVLVNASNLAWFGDSVAMDQHLQIARWRAMEFGRPVLRATNTGATAVIDHFGMVTAQLPRLTRAALDAEVQGRSGLTPYAFWVGHFGLWPLWAIVLVAIGVCVFASARREDKTQHT